MGRVLAVDLGERRVGLALSDPSRTIASGLRVMRRSTREAEFAALRALVEAEDVDLVVVGMPLGMGGEPGVQAELTRRWVDALRPALPVPVEVVDERLTTVQAHRALDAMGVRRRAQRGRVDAVAATLLLQSYLDRARASNPTNRPAPEPRGDAAP
jgi:putative Holliday junction resolvase